MTKKHTIGFLLAMLTLSLAASAQAGKNKPASTTSATTKAPAATANPSPSPSPSPGVNQGQAIYLVRSTLMMLNDANFSGNYTVLRDLASPDFQARNSAADLGQIFFELRRRRFDLFAVSFANPTFNPNPVLDPSGKMHLAGFFPTRPLQIKFDLTFQVVGGQWKLYSIAVATPEAPKQQSLVTPPPSSQEHKGKPFYGVHLFQGTVGWTW